MSFDLLATAVIGIALVVWLLEDERERQVHAAELAKRRERAQASVYRISEAARTVRDLPELFRSIHESLAGVLPARNFYIALHDPASGLLSFPYFSDERDATPAPKPLGAASPSTCCASASPCSRPRGLPGPRGPPGRGADRQRLGRLAGGAAAGRRRGHRGGGLQTYDPAVRLGPEDRDLFVFVCGQIAAAIEAKRAGDALRESETRLRVAIQQVPAVLWTTDEELRFTSSLGAGLAGLGLAPNQVVGLSLEQYLGADSAHLAATASRCKASRSGTSTSRTAAGSQPTSSRSGTPPGRSGAPSASPWTSRSCGRPTRRSARPRRACARSSTSCRTSSSPRTRRVASCL